MARANREEKCKWNLNFWNVHPVSISTDCTHTQLVEINTKEILRPPWLWRFWADRAYEVVPITALYPNHTHTHLLFASLVRVELIDRAQRKQKPNVSSLLFQLVFICWRLKKKQKIIIINMMMNGLSREVSWFSHLCPSLFTKVLFFSIFFLFNSIHVAWLHYKAALFIQ